MRDSQWASITAYITGAIGLLVLLARSLPQMFGPVGRAIETWTDARRRARNAATQAEMNEVHAQIASLTAALADMRAKARTHGEWDRKVYRLLLQRGESIEFPPDLF